MKNHGRDTGDGIEVDNAQWNFSTAVKNFDEHVKKSIPLYDLWQDYIAQLASFFLHENSTVYEIGCSTGVLSEKVLKRNPLKKYKYIALDTVPEMIIKAKQRLKSDKRAETIINDAITYDYNKCCLFLSYYTIQFIHPSMRQELINKIYQSLEWGGAFIMFEKVRGPDARFQDILTQLYMDYKTEQGFNESEIVHKTRSLKGILEPFSTEGNLGLLKRAGFVDIMILCKYLCFEGYLCIK
ncbi:MAG: methyltransferase domain-containing protein [Spirochaetes bacterium]|nr:methyltransferase domain-containing protein [Spirochaetota bacterium]